MPFRRVPQLAFTKRDQSTYKCIDCVCFKLALLLEACSVRQFGLGLCDGLLDIFSLFFCLHCHRTERDISSTTKRIAAQYVP